MYGQMQESGLTEVVLGCAPQLSRASILCLNILSFPGLQSVGFEMAHVLSFLSFPRLTSLHQTVISFVY